MSISSLRIIATLILMAFLFKNSLAQGPFDQKKKSNTNVDQLAPDHPQNPNLQHIPLFGRTVAQPQKPKSLPPLQTLLNKSGLKIQDIKYSSQTELPIFLKKEANDRSIIQDAGTAQTRAFEELDLVKQLLQVSNVNDEFETMKTEKDELDHWHIKVQQVFAGIEVYGSELIVHFQPSGDVILSGRTVESPDDVNSTPSISELAALELAKDDLSAHSKISVSTLTKDGFDFNEVETELVFYNPNLIGEHTHLAWHFTLKPNFLERWEYFVDAHSGEILNHYNHTCSVGPVTASAQDLNSVSQTINVFESGGTYYMLDASRPMYTGGTTNLPQPGNGSIVTLDLQNTNLQNPQAVDVTSPNNIWNHPTAVSAHVNAAQSYEYFGTTFNRNSINGQGGDVVSYVNVADDVGGGLDNAFWNGEYMFYGNGAQNFFPLAASLDVGGHEMTHGVVQNTANLEYQDEPGALNESFADVFGVMIDRDDWQLGEGVVKTSYIPTGFLRDMADPHNGGNSLNDPGWQPSHTNEQYTGSQDNGGVHINSGIPNHAFYLIATDIGKAEAEQIYYRALSQYLTKSSRFIDARIAVVQAATDLHGANSNQVNATKNAFDAVGILNGNGGDYQDDLQTNPGQDFIIFKDANSADPVQIYIATTDATGFTPVTQIVPRAKTSVTDDGLAGLFVANDNNMQVIDMSTATPSVSAITTDAFWDNAAVSKNGTKLAGISTFIDTSIYIYDYGTQQWGQFVLYNPTTAQGVNFGGVLYADAIEWDYSGEFVMYDAYNVIPNQFGQDYDYWDVGFIHVWNNSSNTWGSGEVFNLFSGLPEGVSIGNPSFAKNSPHIVCFDLFDLGANQNSVIAVNIETGEIGTLWNQAILGYPSYSKNDDKIVFSGLDASSNPVIDQVGLLGDKITSDGNVITLIPQAEWPVWFTQGSRPLLGVGESRNEFGLNIYPNPSSDWAMITLDDGNISAGAEIRIYDLNGKLVHSQSISNHVKVASVTLNTLARGVHIVEIISDKAAYKGRLLKE